MGALLGIPGRIGMAVESFLSEAGEITIFTLKLLYRSVTPPFYFREFMKSMTEVGVNAIVPMVLMSFAFTTSIVVMGYSGVTLLGVANYTGGLALSVLIGDMAVILPGSILGGRSGCAVAAEISTMKESEEVDALTIMGMDTLRYLGVPRFLALFFNTIFFTFLGVMVIMVISFVIVVYMKKGCSVGGFMNGLTFLIVPNDLYFCFLKAGLVGLVGGAAATYHGFKSTPGAGGIGPATNKAITYCYMLAITILMLVDLFIY